MKMQFLLLLSGFLLMSALSYSQDKGYYSIGNNREKLKIAGQAGTTDSFVRVDKGYYHIQSNSRKLRRSLGTGGDRTMPPVTKGYYSIGNNQEKLLRSK